MALALEFGADPLVEGALDRVSQHRSLRTHKIALLDDHGNTALEIARLSRVPG
jgi:hypothetical protein